jgi:molybdopterin converting factor small subunit
MAEPPDVEVRLPPALLRLYPQCPDRHRLRAATVAEAIDALDARWPGLGARLRDERPSLRRHIAVFVDGRPAGLATPLPDGARMIVLTAITGG